MSGELIPLALLVMQGLPGVVVWQSLVSCALSPGFENLIPRNAR
jgi:hypothetical protein